jgi:hypothetical protein
MGNEDILKENMEMFGDIQLFGEDWRFEGFCQGLYCTITWWEVWEEILKCLTGKKSPSLGINTVVIWRKINVDWYLEMSGG